MINETEERSLKEIKLKIVKKDKELFFDYEGLLFDRLDAYDMFTGGQLIVKRGNEIVDKTASIREYGTHGACTCFIGLKGNWAISGIIPERYLEGDEIFIKFKCNDDFDPSIYFRAFLIKDATRYSAMTNFFEGAEGRSFTLKEVSQGYVGEINKILESKIDMRIVRFRR